MNLASLICLGNFTILDIGLSRIWLSVLFPEIVSLVPLTLQHIKQVTLSSSV